MGMDKRTRTALLCCAWACLVLALIARRPNRSSGQRRRHRARVPQQASAERPLDRAPSRTVPSLEMTLESITPGGFTMGSRHHPRVWAMVRSSAHSVELTRPFWIATCEVTQAQYTKVMGRNPSHFVGTQLPAEQVTWEEAMEFCRKLTEMERAADRLPTDFVFRLPSEAEWEYCCRAGTTGEHAGRLSSMAWYAENAEQTTHPVGQKRANSWGLYDMHGNVCEWCWDWQADYSYGTARDPIGPANGSHRVVRGGSWLDDPLYCGSAQRSRGDPERASSLIGFRVVLGPKLAE